MAKIQWVYDIIKGIAFSFWGLTVVDLLAITNLQLLDGFDGVIKTAMAFAGFVYFIVTIPHKLKMQALERETKRLNNRMLNEEVEAKELSNDIEKKILC